MELSWVLLPREELTGVMQPSRELRSWIHRIPLPEGMQRVLNDVSAAGGAEAVLQPLEKQSCLQLLPVLETERSLKISGWSSSRPLQPYINSSSSELMSSGRFGGLNRLSQFAFFLRGSLPALETGRSARKPHRSVDLRLVLRSTTPAIK